MKFNIIIDPMTLLFLSSLLDTNDKCTKGFCVKVAKCKEQNDINMLQFETKSYTHMQS